MNGIKIYKEIYNLQTINLSYIKENSISFIFFDNDNYYLNKDNSFISYSSYLSLNIVYLIENIEKIYGLVIYNFFPICFTKNNSIVFACKIREKNTKIKVCDKKKINKIISLIDSKKEYYSDEYDDERLLIEKYSHRYKIYHNFIKKYIINEKRRKKSEYLNLIANLINCKSNNIIDVSCGDNDDIFKICKDKDLVVGNDINFYVIKKAEEKYKNVLFTNNNILNLDYNNSFFDISYCKNTLHHLKNTNEINLALNNLYKISNKIIIVEIENPKVTGGLPKILNKYLYTKYLKDAGKEFLNFEIFKEIIDQNFNDKSNVSYLTFENILGKYMIAVIEKR